MTSSILWGPTLDAEVAYRQETARRAYRRGSRTVRAARRTPSPAHAAAPAAPVAQVPAAQGAVAALTPAPDAPGARRWSLSGSEAWPAA